MNQARRLASRLVEKTFGRNLVNMPLAEQVRIAKGTIEMAIPMPFMPISREQRVANVRSNLLSDLPSDIKEKAKKGMTRAGIKTYYWSCPEFVEFWTKDLQMTEYMLDLQIEKAQIEQAK